MRFESISNKASVAWLLFRESLRSFSANRNLGSAAGLAYYGFLSLMPLLLLAIFALGRVIRSSEDAFAGMAGLLTQMFPAFSQAILQDLMNLAQQRAWGVLSIVLLLWSITPFAGAIRGAVAYIFKTERKLHFVLAKLLDLAAVIALLVLFVSLVAGRVYYNMQTGAWLDPTVIWDDVLAQALGVLLTVLVLAFFFFVFAPVRLPWTHLGAGAIVTTLLFFIIRPLFGLILKYNPDYGYAFGSLKAIFLLLVWVYYTFAVVLYGAEVMAALRRKDALLLRGFLAAGNRTPRAPAHLAGRFVSWHAAGEVLFHEGDAGAAMYHVLAGAVQLTHAGHTLKVMGPGEYFGEMSLLLGAPRTATATIAAPDTQLVQITQANFELILRENPPIMRDLLKELAVRLQRTNEAAARAAR